MSPVVLRVGAPSRSVVADEDLLAAVRAAPVGPDVVRVERESSRYSTSATVEDVRVHLRDGTLVPLLLKDLAAEALLEEALVGKPSFLADPERELSTYRELLPAVEDRAPACWAAQEGWLLLEKVPGVELYQVGDFALWRAAAGVAASLHRDLTKHLATSPGAGRHLLRQDHDYLSQWRVRALSFAGPEGGARLAALRQLTAAHEACVSRLTALPSVVLHGDLYASNVLVVRGATPRVCAVDWEMTSLGPAVLDLAALTSGDWSEGERRELARSYYGEMQDPRWDPSWEDFLVALDIARLHVAVQWLGWSAGWIAPQEHARDWLAEAQGAATRVFG